ncbi:MAG: rhomboid family intramembrane serine protease [Flavobacteriales bacterium]|jgi:membrane associated rhomboid family serine protease|nr:rhomboid family intramembrane serine protease [Flavobacteriales bacterium]
MRLINKLIKDFKNTNILYKLIYINVGIFLTYNILIVMCSLFMLDASPSIEKLILPSNTNTLIKQPWSIISYMFFHKTFIHLLFNMIWLHFSGKLFLDYFSEKQFLSTYFMGGICGGLLFILSFNYLPAFEIVNQNAKAMGASASVLAIMFAISTHIPNYRIQIPFIGMIKIKYLAFALIILDIISIPKGNAGGHIAHIGGALFGYIYIKQLNNGVDISKNLYQIINMIFAMNIFGKKNNIKKNQNKIDNILEKISKSGYSSLNKNEKEILFKASKRNK